MASGQPVTANSSLGAMTLDAGTLTSITGAMPRQERLVDHGDPVPVPVLDLHRVADVQRALLDLHQFRAAGVLEDQCLAQPQSLAVDLVDPLALVVLDPVVITDRDQLLPHPVMIGLSLAATLLAPFAEHCPLFTLCQRPAAGTLTSRLNVNARCSQRARVGPKDPDQLSQTGVRPARPVQAPDTGRAAQTGAASLNAAASAGRVRSRDAAAFNDPSRTVTPAVYLTGMLVQERRSAKLRAVRVFVA
jgi:hypothetical protein